MKNEYLTDAKIFIMRSASFINNEIKNEDAIIATLFFALGMERFLKGLLFEINPAYVLKVDDFSNTFQCYHSDKIIKGQEKAEVFKKVDEDVINFRNSILRCKTFSPSVLKHANMLFELNRYRDIIAHCRLSLLSQKNLKEILQRDFYQFLSELLTEKAINVSTFFGKKNIPLARLSSSLVQELKKRMDILINAHKNEWEKIKKSKKKVNHAEKITFNYLQNKDFKAVECPVCANLGFIKTEVEYEYDHIEKALIAYS